MCVWGGGVNTSVGVSYISNWWLWTRITAVHLSPLYYTSMPSFVNIQYYSHYVIGQ